MIALLLASCGERRTTTVTTDSTGTQIVGSNGSPRVPQSPSPEAPPVTRSPKPDTLSEPQIANITVSYPRAGQVIRTNPLVIQGTARTFENAVAYQLFDRSRKEIAAGHGTAVGEMGVHSPYTLSVVIPDSVSGAATLEVFEFSAKDGSRINLVRVPLTIQIPRTP